MKFIHLSDLHLVAPDAFLHGLDPQDRLRRCVAHIRSFHADAAFVVSLPDEFSPEVPVENSPL